MQRDYQLLSIIVPMHNEQDVLNNFFDSIMPILHNLQHPAEIVCVNDGSHDKTLPRLQLFQQQYSEIVVVDFHRNFGKEAAMTAGLEYASGDIIIPMDADLQDPPGLIPRLIEKWQEGADEVLAVRSTRETDSWLKRQTAQAFYHIFNYFAEHKIPYNTGDFRLMDKSIAKVALQLPEKNRFMKGIYSWASNGNTAVVEYERDSRSAGNSKWDYWKLWNFAIDGITAFSSWPLRVWSYVGGAISTLAVIFMLIIFIEALFFGNPVEGYPSMMCVILFLGGVQLITLGIMGEYIARIYNESKNRPLYLVRKVIRNNQTGPPASQES